MPPSVEETGVVLSALGQVNSRGGDEHVAKAIESGARWLCGAVEDAERAAAPIGLYFARLWYYEELYPLIFAVEGLASARRGVGGLETTEAPGGNGSQNGATAPTESSGSVSVLRSADGAGP